MEIFKNLWQCLIEFIVLFIIAMAIYFTAIAIWRTYGRKAMLLFMLIATIVLPDKTAKIVLYTYLVAITDSKIWKKRPKEKQDHTPAPGSTADYERWKAERKQQDQNN